ncbi:hypothetical protein BDV97DRAFT_355836 [Delphinella strobiligena]|nr:hypothetical protein BDV97DRAFT_355836 [Delphinella strobiligena]
MEDSWRQDTAGAFKYIQERYPPSSIANRPWKIASMLDFAQSQPRQAEDYIPGARIVQPEQGPYTGSQFSD